VELNLPALIRNGRKAETFSTDKLTVATHAGETIELQPE